MSKIFVLIQIISVFVFAETLQCNAVLLKAKYYSDRAVSELKKSNPDYCIVADNLEQQLNWLGSAKRYCSNPDNVRAANELIVKLTPALMTATQKCGH